MPKTTKTIKQQTEHTPIRLVKFFFGRAETIEDEIAEWVGEWDVIIDQVADNGDDDNFGVTVLYHYRNPK